MKHEALIILGIDPGLERTGFGIVLSEAGKLSLHEYGVFYTDKGKPFQERLLEVEKDFSEVMKKWKPDMLAIEKLIFVKNVTNGLQVAHARGVIMARAAEKGLKIVECMPTEIKKHITGNGRAKKPQIQRVIQMIFGLSEIPKPDDAADAIAVAVTASQTIR